MSASLRMESLVEELLFLSKMDAGAMVPNMERQSLNALIVSCLEYASPQAQKEGIQLLFTPEQNQPDLLFDRALLGRAINNILSNALRFAKNQVEVSARFAGRVAVIEVKDDGPGIAAEDLGRLFERFYAGQRGQSGVGLSIAQEIFLHHKGKISAENTGNGALIRVSLPAGPG